jgi:hypothetical protein
LRPQTVFRRVDKMIMAVNLFARTAPPLPFLGREMK